MKQLLNTLYVITPGSCLHLQNEAIAINIGGDEKARVPAHTIDAVYCFGNTTVSTPLIGYCGQHGIAMVFLSENGRFYGRIQGPVQGNILLRRDQFSAMTNGAAKAELARSFLLGKLINSKDFLLRMGRERPGSKEALQGAAQQMAKLAKQMRDSDVDTMRGLEGVAAAAYFGAMPVMLLSDELSFSGRNRHPPEDPVNALLSFLYTLLKNDVQSALEGVGLDPAAGFLHALRPGRPSLALDVMEELRAPLCDRLAVSLINRRQITRKSFAHLTPPVQLSEEGRKTVLKAWQERKREEITHPYLQEKMPIGLIPHMQARLLARTIRGELDGYPPFHWR